MTEEKVPYNLRFIVRDYECDLQGVVNNANYQHYLEHARHEFLISKLSINIRLRVVTNSLLQ